MGERNLLCFRWGRLVLSPGRERLAMSPGREGVVLSPGRERLVVAQTISSEFFSITDFYTRKNSWEYRETPFEETGFRAVGPWLVA